MSRFSTYALFLGFLASAVAVAAYANPRQARADLYAEAPFDMPNIPPAGPRIRPLPPMDDPAPPVIVSNPVVIVTAVD